MDNKPVSSQIGNVEGKAQTESLADPKSRMMLTSPIILGEITLASPETQTTVGTAGGATALPATPSGYLKVTMNDAEYVLPYYKQS